MAATKLTAFFLCALIALAASTSAFAQIISYRFDGVYQGAATLAEEISDPKCVSLSLNEVEIRNGILRAWDTGGRQTVKGIITGSGFFNSDYYFPGDRAALFEGFVDHRGKLTGGVTFIDCAWVIELQKIGTADGSPVS